MAMTKEREAELMSKFKFQYVDGMKHIQYLKTPDVTKQLEIVRQLKIRDDDIITLGFPRSGNHWAFEVINMVVHETTTFTEEILYNVLIESLGDDTHAILSKLSSPRILTSHNHVNRLPDQATKKRVKLIYILRNPKDALLSLYKFVISIKEEVGNFTGTWDEFLQLQLSGDFVYGSWFDHVLTMEKFMNKHPEYPIYIHIFEEMKKDPVGNIKDLCSFLDKPDTLAHQIAAVTEFSNMKKVVNDGKLGGTLQTLGKVRSGIGRTGSLLPRMKRSARNSMKEWPALDSET